MHAHHQIIACRNSCVAGLATGPDDPAPNLRGAQRAVIELTPTKRQGRSLNPEHVAEAARSIAAFVFTAPLLIGNDGAIVDGHVRWEAAKAAGLDEVSCISVARVGKHGLNHSDMRAYAGAGRKAYPANARNDAHPTSKPVELVRDALLDVIGRGGIAIDPFRESGAAIMAAHVCRHVAYGIELDLDYRDLIVTRCRGRPARRCPK